MAPPSAPKARAMTWKLTVSFINHSLKKMIPKYAELEIL
jgi:hypothetical protein